MSIGARGVSGKAQRPTQFTKCPFDRLSSTTNFSRNPVEMPHTDALVVLTTVANTDEGVALIKGLLERRLIACGTILPGARSLYRWEGKVADEQEVVVLLKTRSARLELLETAFGDLHPYKLPELLALPVASGLARYLEWLNDETSLALA